jgi:Protein of unknown function (DUF1653)
MTHEHVCEVCLHGGHQVDPIHYCECGATMQWLPAPSLPAAPPIGVYRHYKGGLYTLVAIAETHHHNGDLDAVYVSHTTEKIVTRPLLTYGDSRNDDAWCDLVRWPDGTLRLRFTPHDLV